MDAFKMYVIESNDEKDCHSNAPMFWHNQCGWIEFEHATKFTQEEKDRFNLPLDSKWVDMDVYENTLTCEMCGTLILGKVEFTLNKRTFCSQDCLDYAEEEMSIERREAREQYEMYVNDLDSWYR